MGLIVSLRDRFIIKPVADRIISTIKETPTTKADTPKAFEVPMSFNSGMGNNNKRMTSSAVDFPILRQLSIQHETTRAAINTRKRQITQLDFDIVDVQNDLGPQSDAKQQETVRQMILNIGGPGVRFRELIDKLIEDLLVLGGMAYYKQRQRGGKLLRIIPVDAATIKLRVDQAGMTPMPPEFAFEQWIAGKKVADLTTDELGYEILNPRTDSPYGLAPIESLVISLDASMRAMLYNLAYLSDNNVPQGFLQVPENWTINQMKEYKEFFDAMVSGAKATSKVYPIPAGMTYTATSKPSDYSFGEFFDLLDRRVCMLFDIQPQELGITLKQYKENAEGQERIQIRKGIKPLANFFEEIFTEIIRNEFGYTNLAFKFVGLDGRYTNDDIKALVPLGILSVDEARNDRGLAKIGAGNMIVAGNTIIPIGTTTTVSGTEEVTTEDEEDAPALGSQKLHKMLEKVSSNRGLDAVEKQKNFKDFRRKMKVALGKQVAPFTKEATIARVLETEKAEFQGIVENNVDEETESLQIYFDNDSINEFLKWAAEQGGKQAYDTLGITSSFTLTSADFKKMLGDRANYLIDSVDSTTKDWLVNQIMDGKDLSYTNAEIAQKISDEVDEFTLARANMIVNTEVANALGTAQVDIYEKQGIEEKQWVTSEDEKVCPICEPLDGEIVKVDDEFSSGDDHEPAHPNCRCYTQAVIEEAN